jgi:hypothetical protein
MISLALILALMLPQQAPKYNPNGFWEAETGSQFEIRQSGPELQVKIVPGSNPRFREYSLEMKNEEEVNTYSGKGFFVTTMEGGKECKLETQWRFIVVGPDRIIGVASSVVPDPRTCEVKEKGQTSLDLKRRK